MGNTEYDIDALKNGVEKCRDNIKVFEKAIDGENQTIREYKRMIATLEEKKAIENDNKK